MLSQTFAASALGLFLLTAPTTQSGSVGAERVGEILVENAVVLSNNQVTQVSGIKQGQLIDDQVIEKGVARIKKAYLERGFIEVRASIKKIGPAQPGENDKTVNLQIKIEEGPRFLIGQTEVEGNHMTNHNVIMRAAGGLRPDRPYNPEDVEKWVRGLNRLGRFKLVKKEDIEITIDQHEHLVHLLFHLTEKPGLKILRH